MRLIELTRLGCATGGNLTSRLELGTHRTAYMQRTGYEYNLRVANEKKNRKCTYQVTGRYGANKQLASPLV